MFEGIKVLNAGKEIDLSKFEISVNNEIIIGNLNSLKIYVENGAKYSPAQLQVLENGNDVKIALEDSEGNDIFLILKGLNEMLLTNPNELPVFEVFDEGIQLASFVNVEDLDAAAAGGDTTSASQTEDFANGNPASIGNAVGESGGNLDGFNRVGNADALNLDQNYQPVVFDVTLSENEVLGVHEAGDKNIITGQFLVTDQNPEDTGLHTFSIVEGTVVITSSSGVITQIDDEIEITLNSDGTYEISGDFNDLALGENATINFDYTATDPRGFESLPATFTLNMVGTNDQPVVEDIDMNSPKLVNVFFDSTYSGINSDFYEEAYTIKETLLSQGHSVNLLDESNLNNFLSTTNTLLMPESEKSSYTNLSNESKNSIEDFVSSGGTLILSADGGGKGLSFLNELFDFELTLSGYSINETYSKTSFISDSIYKNASSSLSWEDGTYPVEISSLPENAISYYELENKSALFEIPVENGKIVFIAYDWYNAAPVGEQDGGWLNILNHTVLNSANDFYETSDSNIEDTNENGILRDEDGNNIFKGILSVNDDDNTDTHTFHVEEGSLEIEAAIELNDVSIDIRQDEEGNWIYEINGDFTNLAEGEKALVSFQYYADDGNIDLNGESNESERATISLEVSGTNDQPVIEDINTGTIKEESLSNKASQIFFEDAVLSIDSNSSSSLKALSNLQDDDINDTHTFKLASDSNIKVNGQNEIEIEAITINTSDIEVIINEDGSYSISNEKFNSLGEGESFEISFDYVAIDSSNSLGESNTSEPKKLTLTIEGTNDQPVINNITVSSNNSEHSFKDLVLGEGENQKTYQNGKIEGSLSFDVNDEDINDGHEFVSFKEVPVIIEEVTYNQDRTDSPIDVINEPILVSLNEDGSFEIINKNFDNLGFGESIKISFAVQVSDGTVTTHQGNLTDKVQTETSEGELSSNSAISEPYKVTMTIHGSNDKPTISTIKMGVDTLIYETNDIDENDTSEPQDGILRNDEALNNIKGEFVAFDDDLNDSHTFEVLSMKRGNETVELYDNGLGKTSEIKIEVSSSDINPSLIDIEQIILTNNNKSSEAKDSKTNFELLGDFTSLGAGETATIKFMYQANDNQNDFIGEASLSEPQIVEIVVTGTNDQPLVEDIILDSKSWYFNDNSTDNLTINGATTEHSKYNETSWSNEDNHVLNFNGAGERSVMISDLDTTKGGTLSFDFIYGTDYNGGEEVDFLNGDYNPVELQYSKDNGLTWNSYKLFDSSYKDGNWKNISIALENELVNEDIDFRLIQLNHSGSSFDHWAIDNLEVGVLNYESSDSDYDTNTLDDVKTVLIGKLEASDEDINDTVKFETKDLSVSSLDVDNSLITLDGITLTKNEYGDDTKRAAEFEIVGDFNALGLGEKAVVTFKYRAVDDSSLEVLAENKESEYKTVSMTVLGTNDQPIIEKLTYKNIFFEKDDLLSNTNEHSILEGDIDFSVIDADSNDLHEFVAQDNIAVKVDGQDSSLTASLDSSGTFRINNPAFNNLAAGEELILTFDVQIKDDSISTTSLDESNTSEFKTVTLKVVGTNDQPVVEDVSILNEEENLTKNGLNTIQGTFTTLNIDEDTNDTHTYNILSFDNSTNIEDVVGVDFKRLENINYDANGDGSYESDIDIAVKLPSNSEFKLEDIDIKGIEIKGSNFNLIGDFNALPEDEVLTIKFLYNVVDSSKLDTLGDNESNTSNSKWVTITVKGTQDDAEISYHEGQNEGATSEDGVLKTKGKLDIKDIDAGELFEVQTLVETTYGTFSINENGYWNYELKNSKVQFLSEKQEVFDTIVVKSEDGQDSEEIKISIIGNNDTATILGTQISGEVTEDKNFDTGFLSTKGELSVNDVDNNEAEFKSLEDDSKVGTFKMEANGKWIFTVANNDSKVQELGLNEKIVQTYLVESKDGTDSQIITVTIKGTNDTPKIDSSSTLVSSLKESSEITVSIDADGFTVGTDISNAFDGMTLSTSDGQPIYSALSYDNIASTGTNIFSDRSSPNEQYNTFGDMKIVFDKRVTFISADFIADDSSDTGRISIYDSENNLIDSVSTGSFGPKGEVITLELNSYDKDIAYAILDDAGRGLVNIDNIKVTYEEHILKTKETISFSDVDINDSHTLHESFVSAVWTKNDSSTENLNKDLGSLTFNSLDNVARTVNWEYEIKDKLVDFLAQGETLEITYNVLVKDNSASSADTSSTEQIVITIVGTNDAPIAILDTRETIYNENNGWKSFAVLKNDTDADASDVLTLDTITSASISWADQVRVLVATDENLVKIVDNKVKINTSSLDFLPKDANAKLEVSYTMSDNSTSSSSTVTFNIKGKNDKPSLEDDSYTVEESSLLTLTSIDSNNLLSNDKDPDFGDSISIKEFYFAGKWHNVGNEVLNSKGAALSVNADGSFTFNQNGVYESLDETQNKNITFKYKVIDSNAETKIATAKINITGENDAPEVVNKSIVLFKNTAILNLGLNAWDVDDKNLEVKFSEIPDGVTLKNGDSLDTNSTYTVKQLQGLKFNPADDGNFELKYSVSDGQTSTDGKVNLLVQNNLVEDGYTKFDGHYYQNFEVVGSGTISEAKDKANDEGGELVSIQNIEENTFINSLSPTLDVWLNMTDEDKEGTWTKLDSKSIENSYTNWESGEPNDWGSAGEDYVEMHHSTGKWNDIEESGSYRGDNSTIVEKDSNILVGNEYNNTLLYSKDASLIDGKEGDDTLTFRETFENIDFASVLDGAIKNFASVSGKEDYTSLKGIEELDLSAGKHILSNISVEDVLAMSDNNTLKISGTSDDTINLDNTQWIKDSSSNEYINISNGTLAEGSVKLLIEEDIQVNI